LPAHTACTRGETLARCPAFVLPGDCQTGATAAARLQIENAGVRLAAIISASLK